MIIRKKCRFSNNIKFLSRCNIFLNQSLDLLFKYVSIENTHSELVFSSVSVDDKVVVKSGSFVRAVGSFKVNSHLSQKTERTH